jgi:Ulp1 family protease
MPDCGKVRTYSEPMLRFIADEASVLGKRDFDKSKWKVKSPSATPTQRNSHDCGVFVMVFLHLLSVDRPLDFDQEFIDQCRTRLVLVLTSEVVGTNRDMLELS